MNTGIDDNTTYSAMATTGLGLGKAAAYYFQSTATLNGGAFSSSPVDSGAVKTINISPLTTTAGRYYGIEADKEGRLFVNVPWTSSAINNAGSAAKPVYIENGEAKQCTGLSAELLIPDYDSGTKALGDVIMAAFSPISMSSSTGTNQLTLQYGSKYAISLHGDSFVFTMPSSPLNAVGFGSMSEMGAFKYQVTNGEFTESCHIQGYISDI